MRLGKGEGEKTGEGKESPKIEKIETAQRKTWKLVSLAAAELAFFLAWSSYSTSPLASILNPVFLLPLAVIPAITVFTKKNPFSFEFFSLLMLMIVPKIFPSTPLFKSVVNTVNFLGFTSVASYMVSILTPQPTPSLPAIVALFCFAQMAENCRKVEFGVLTVIALLAYIIYPIAFMPVKPEYFFAIIAIGVAAIALAAYEFA